MKIEIDFVIVKPHVDEDKEEDLYPPPGLTLDDLEAFFSGPCGPLRSFFGGFRA